MENRRKEYSVFTRINSHLAVIESLGIVPREVMEDQYRMVEELEHRREELARAIAEADLIPIQAELDTAVWASNNPNIMYHMDTDVA